MNEMQSRLDAVRTQLGELEADALIVTQEYNRRYLTGFSGSAGIVVVTPSEARLLVDFRYLEQAVRVANRAAGIKVMKFGTAAVSKAELFR